MLLRVGESFEPSFIVVINVGFSYQQNYYYYYCIYICRDYIRLRSIDIRALNPHCKL